MNHSLPSTNAPVPAGSRAVAGVALASGLGLVFAAFADGSWYAWRDVALVHFVCALPLALMLGTIVRPRTPPASVVALAVGALALGFAPLLVRSDVAGSDAVAGYALRPVPALGAALGAVLAAAALVGFRRPSPAPHVGWRPALALGALGVAALMLAPATYVGARCRHDTAKLGELLEQSRYGEARVVVRGLLVLDPGRTWNGRPLPEVAAQIEQVVTDLEARVAALEANPTPRARFERARTLAMLGRTDEALDVLALLGDGTSSPEVESLRGTIYETRGDWEPGLVAYRAAHEAWERRPESPARAAGQLRATVGAAYCLRKLGRYDEAEAAYRDVLARAPTADSHFLLAQFYDDAQQAAKAREHARRAVELDPERYRRDGERLIRKLSVYQFGCLAVFEAEGGTPASDSGGGLDRIR